MNRSTPGLPVHHQHLEFTQGVAVKLSSGASSWVSGVPDILTPPSLLSSMSTPPRMACEEERASVSLRADFCSRGSWLQPPRPPKPDPPEQSSEGRGRSGRQGVPAGKGEPLLPSTTMGILISSVCWLWASTLLDLQCRIAPHARLPWHCNPSVCVLKEAYLLARTSFCFREPNAGSTVQGV